MIKLHDGQITDLLNNSFRYNPETISIGYAVRQEKQRIMALAEQTRLMSAIYSLPERTLDYLAVELRTPAYRQYFSLEVKRRLIAATIPFYAHLGTPAAVDMVINAIFTEGHIQEWFEYGGNPHHFRVFVNLTGRITQLHETEEMQLLIGDTKRLSSWLDEVRYLMETEPSIIRTGGAVGAIVTMPIPAQPDEYSFKQTVRTGGAVGVEATIPVPQAPDIYELRTGKLRTGGGVGVAASIPIPAKPDSYDFRQTVRTGGGLGVAAQIPVPAQQDKYDFRQTLRTGGGAGVTARIPVPTQPDRYTFRQTVQAGGSGGLEATVPVPEQPDKFRFESKAPTGGAIAGVGATIPVPEQPDNIRLEGTVSTGGGGAGITATVPIPEGKDRLELRSEIRTGGKNSVISTTPAVELKEE